MKFLTIATVLSTLFLASASSADRARSASDDLVTSLPSAPPLKSSHYSGYISASSTKNLHYYFVESLGPDPSFAPTIIWLNGGPGCSSLDGFLYEHGPYRVGVRSTISADGTTYDEAYLTEFEHSWAYLGNMLYIEAPVGVGFSYSSAETEEEKVSDYQCNDDTTANDNLEALKSWFARFPQYASNDLYITGESYGGIYVPTLAEAILNDSDFPASLKGIAVGNGCSGTEVGICSWGDQGSALEAKFLTSSGFLPEDLKSSINDSCDYDSWFNGNGVSKECEDNIDTLNKFTSGLDTYCVYCDCPANKISSHSKIHGVNHLLKSKMDRENLKKAPEVETKACINTYEASMYLNRPDVQAAINVGDSKVSDWEVCHTAPGWDYTSTRPNLPRDTYPQLVSSIDVLIYNGDWDACVPYTDGESWTRSMNFTETTPWHVWETKAGDIGGYATVYDVQGKFEFVTIKGGRHEVPETEPIRAFEVIERFLGGEDF